MNRARPLQDLGTSLKFFPHSFKLLWSVDHIMLLKILLLTLLQSVIPPLMAVIAKFIIDGISQQDMPVYILLFYVAAEAVLAVTLNFSSAYSQASQAVLREKLWQDVSTRFGAHAASLDLEFFEQPANYNLLAKAQSDLGFRPMMMTLALVRALQELGLVISFVVTVLIFSPILASLLIIALIPVLFASAESGHISFQSYDLTTNDGRRAAYFDSLLTSEQPAKEVRLFGIANYLLKHRQDYAAQVVDKRIKAEYAKSALIFRTNLLASFAQYASMGYAVYLAYTNQITIGALTLMIAALGSVRLQTSLLLNDLGSFLENSLFFREFTSFFATTPKLYQPAVPVPCDMERIKEITFENVTFAYPGAQKPTLEAFNLTLRGGETTAIVGVNGAGKTTLVKLLMRLYDPQVGTIKINDVAISEYELDKYRANFAVILQDFMKYQLNLTDNIILGDINRPYEQGFFNHITEAARVHEFASRLPKGYETILGRQFDLNGQNLSGGQWQRIALARALYRNAPVLILDEPTASLDAEAEAQIFDAYKDFSKGRTSIIITHRFNTVRFADRIVVLDNGIAVEDGTHQELMRLGGRYFNMFTAQASAYDLAPLTSEVN
jgi:ATP-binding cassette subfamily B protein